MAVRWDDWRCFQWYVCEEKRTQAWEIINALIRVNPAWEPTATSIYRSGVPEPALNICWNDHGVALDIHDYFILCHPHWSPPLWSKREYVPALISRLVEKLESEERNGLPFRGIYSPGTGFIDNYHWNQ